MTTGMTDSPRKEDFIAMLQIALKECSESEYWIAPMIERGYWSNKTILYKCIEVKKIFIASINTAKKNKQEHLCFARR